MNTKNVRITNGIFKGIEGVIARIEFNPDIVFKIDVIVDCDNTITVNSDQVEFTDEEYLITITDIETDEISNLYTPYVTKMNINKIDNYILSIYNEINPMKDIIMGGYGKYYQTPIKFRVTATVLSKAKGEFKINGKDVDLELMKKVIEYLK